MSRKLTIDDLTVTSFSVQPTASASAAATDVPTECGATIEDMCLSAGPLCTLDCVDVTRRTNIVYCCG
jgi:hypothetical protein